MNHRIWAHRQFGVGQLGVPVFTYLYGLFESIIYFKFNFGVWGSIITDFDVEYVCVFKACNCCTWGVPTATFVSVTQISNGHDGLSWTHINDLLLFFMHYITELQVASDISFYYRVSVFVINKISTLMIWKHSVPQIFIGIRLVFLKCGWYRMHASFCS